MSLSKLALIVLIFLMSGQWFGWWSVSAKLLGVVGLVFVVLAILEAAGIVGYSLPIHRS